ncbi:cellulose/xylan binding protein with CBM9 domain [Pontibacter ramchanderi]|uniref:Cellulose/xylan binding protein with CBM9 domain n=2 Tax=Pontibacter ramchanderi TaxID=1179743 RepID=A0A2N3U833_9BACT|nr:cellulose/xylan binding protein with CBM9 domain [Pontibacter ramchanderi]
MQLVSSELDKLAPERIENTPWSAHENGTIASFAMAHNNACIFLKYYVTEQAIQAKYRNTNDPVYKDTCVELFIAFEGETAYYNLEFNCLGTCLAEFGSDRQTRRLLPAETIAKIRRMASLRAGHENAPLKTWQLTLVIPTDVFSEHALAKLEATQVRANFYKCGDELPIPHYMTWTAVEAPAPDFHLPEYFGRINFMEAPYHPTEHSTGLCFSSASKTL